MIPEMDKETDVETVISEDISQPTSANEGHNHSRISLAIGVDLEKDSSNEEEEDEEVGVDEQGANIQPPNQSHTHKNRRESTTSTHPPASRTTSTVHRVTTAQDWMGPDDPENPHNWPLWKRTFHTIPPALFAFATTFGSSVYTPASHEIASTFNVSHTAAILPLSLYVIGLAFGPMIAAPLSETYGRLIVYRVSLPISMLFTLGAGFSKTFAGILICRFLAGTAGSPVLAVGAGTNSDLFPPQLRALATAGFLWVPFMGPALG